MSDKRTWKAIGLMSGTSMDGVDAALIESDGEGSVRRCGFYSLPYSDAFRSRLKAVLGMPGDHTVLARELTERHAEAVEGLLRGGAWPLDDIDVIGFHGQTVLHEPEIRRTLQIGAPELLAKVTGRPVVFDLRIADVAAGGEGAPLVPVYHRALTRMLGATVAVLNLGGVANVTWIDGSDGAGPEEMLAFDTGPANALIDDFVRERRGARCDEGGALAAAGRVDGDRLAGLLDDPYFVRQPPKSLDRDHFAAKAAQAVEGMTDADGAALLTAFSAAAVALAAQWFPHPVERWIVCGGGRHNETLMKELTERLGAPVIPADDLGWDGDAVEAEAFAYLAIRSLQGKPLTFPGTTGAPEPLTGGTLHRPG
ncbi:anhydro-N-acetylmuramic acid kinase [Nisaea acidiphila]|uniref:Anhydro-N-acetylmuramic acid kinase n=1 Tax=Nisaea acidiphila TaxID=1862145 RepID=A0A9J7AT28_9PROT|nr:anhydro-N-acetylmuramic acid kinase [Nisaea acidiphila]UUX50843.1 anhydro-N-acetylmuramic acid kinase [Nisaea acidiphila]